MDIKAKLPWIVVALVVTAVALHVVLLWRSTDKPPPVAAVPCPTPVPTVAPQIESAKQEVASRSVSSPKKPIRIAKVVNVPESAPVPCEQSEFNKKQVANGFRPLCVGGETTAQGFKVPKGKLLIIGFGGAPPCEGTFTVAPCATPFGMINYCQKQITNPQGLKVEIFDPSCEAVKTRNR